MNIKEAKPGMRVRYVPGHVHGEVMHKDCEDGIVSSVGERIVFVKFRPEALFGTACGPETLVPMPYRPSKSYLGDAVYVQRDPELTGDQLVLTTEDGISVTNRICLEPEVYAALLAYVARTDHRTDHGNTEAQVDGPCYWKATLDLPAVMTITDVVVTPDQRNAEGSDERR